jgi:3-hydroxyacyl-[acyl-carrier-protein] dehydratase
MAQAGVVAQGIYLYALEFSAEEVEKVITVFTDVNVEFSGQVLPGDRVTTTGRVKFFRRKKLRAAVEMRKDDGSLVCSGELSGMGVPK